MAAWLGGVLLLRAQAGGTGGGYSVGAVAHRDAIGRMQMPQGRCSGPVLPQASSVIRGELFLLCGFLWRDPLGNLEPRNGRGPVTNMERPLEGGGRCLDLDNTARQFRISSPEGARGGP